MHWQWKLYALAMAMVCIAFPLPCMVCIGNGMEWYGMHCKFYALEMEMVWYGTTCIGIGNDNGNGMVCIGNGMNWYGMHGMVWYGMH
jgi:hypothetical protein